MLSAGCSWKYASLQTLSMEALLAHNSEDYSDDPWRITEEQREYYTRQFTSLQPDLGALILGNTLYCLGPDTIWVAGNLFNQGGEKLRRGSAVCPCTPCLIVLEQEAACSSADLKPPFCFVSTLSIKRKTKSWLLVLHSSGSVAKDFFTKSRLSIRELSHIW